MWCFFIPVVGLFEPYRAMRNIALLSNPGGARRVPRAVLTWWLSFETSILAVIPRIVFGRTGALRTGYEFVHMALVTGALTALFVVIRFIVRGQETILLARTQHAATT